MTVAVTGGTGFVGRALLDALERDFLETRALARKVPEISREGQSWIKGDLADDDALARLVGNAEAVIHVAGVTNAPDAAGFHAGNVAGTMAVCRAAQAAGVPRFILVSSLSAREPGLSRYGKSKRQAERIVAASGMDWTIVRPPAVYGPHDGELFELFRSAKWGVVPMPPAGRTSLIHVRDLADLLVALIPQDDRTSHRIFEPDDGKVGGWTHRELGEAIGRAVGRRVWTPALPAAVLRGGARIDGMLRGGGARLTADRVGYMIHPDWVASQDAAVPKDIWQPRIGGTAGLQGTADWYRREGWL